MPPTSASPPKIGGMDTRSCFSAVARNRPDTQDFFLVRVRKSLISKLQDAEDDE